jgi:cell division septation protein DedD
MGRSHPAIALALLACLVALAAPVLAHDVNHLSADAQVSADGTVVLESAYATGDGFVVLYRDWDGRDGEVVGVTPFSAAQADVTEVPVAFDDESWAAVDRNATVTAVLYADTDGDGRFDPAEDDPQVSFGRATQVTFDVARGEAPVYVSAAGIGAQRSAGEVTVREVRLAEAGHLVVSLSEDGEPGRTLGHVSLAAGTHEDVRVSLNRSFLADRDGIFSVFATAYTDGGDVTGRLDAADRPVRADGSLVATRFSVSPVDDVETTTPTSVVNTPTATASSTTDTATVSDTTPTGTTTRSASAEDGSGFGAMAVLAALLAALLVVTVRRRL